MAPPASAQPWFSPVSDEPRGDHVLTCTTGHSPQINAFEGYCHPVAMLEYEIGDRVWIDIPDEIDPDHGRYHAERG